MTLRSKGRRLGWSFAETQHIRIPKCWVSFLNPAYGPLLQILSVTLFEKIPIQQALPSSDYKDQEPYVYKQLNLFDS